MKNITLLFAAGFIISTAGTGALGENTACYVNQGFLGTNVCIEYRPDRPESRKGHPDYKYIAETNCREGPPFYPIESCPPDFDMEGKSYDAIGCASTKRVLWIYTNDPERARSICEDAQILAGDDDQEKFSKFFCGGCD